MNGREMRIVQTWRLAEQSGRVPPDKLAGAVYFGLKGQTPPAEVESLTSAMDLLDYMKIEDTGTSYSFEEKVSLAHEIIELVNSTQAPTTRAIQLISWMPNAALILAIAVVLFSQFSWVVLGAGLAAKFQNGFANHLAAQGHPASGMHSIIGFAIVAASVLASLTHALSDYHFF